MKRPIITLGLIVCLFFEVAASLYRTYQTDDGLSHNSVWATMQDSRGFLWFGTNDGLNCFDGLNFKVYRRVRGDVHSLGNNFIHCLLEMPDGRILVGTKEGLYCYDRRKESFNHVNLDGSPYGADKNSIHCLLFDKNGDLWVGCYGQGIYCLSPDLKLRKHYKGGGLPSGFVTAMAFDLSGALWVGTGNAGMFKLDISSGLASHSPIMRSNVQSIYRSNDNTLWVGTSAEGLYHYDPLSGTIKHITDVTPVGTPVYNIKAITPYGANTLVMGSEGGLILLDCRTEKLRSFNDGKAYDNLPDNSIFAITLDSEGGLWLGSYFHGVCYRSPYINSFSFYTTDDNVGSYLPNDIVKHIVATADGKVMLTSSNRRIVIFDPSTKQMRNFPVEGLSDNVQDVMADGNRVWISDYDRGIIIAEYPSGRKERTYTRENGLPANVVNTMIKTGRGDIYVGTSSGAAVFDGSGFKGIRGLKNAAVMKIIEDYHGNLWFATHFHGLFCLSADGKIKNFRNNGNESSIPGNNLNNIFLDSRGKLWIGTEGEGLAMFNPESGKVERLFTESTGALPSNIIYSTQEDAYGNLWVSTGGGLVKISANDWMIHNFRYLEDLLKIHYSHNSSLCLNLGNMLFFGGSGGFIAFNPAEIKNNSKPPKLSLTSFYINGHQVKYEDGSSVINESIENVKDITLEASQSTFGFDVACLSYLSPGQNRVAYRFKGFDDEWKFLPGTDRHIEYMNIPSGDYTLKVKGVNNAGVWSKPLELKVRIERPFWASNMMLLAYAVLLILALYFIKRRVELAHRRKMVQFSYAKEKELYEAKIGFFTNIAHEIRTPLSLISAPLESIIKSGDGTDRTRNNLSVMKSNVERLLDLINQLLDFRKVESQLMRLNFHRSNVSEIVVNACMRYEEFATLNKIKIDYSQVDQGIECVIDAEAFKKIVGNLMSNAMKFAASRIAVFLKEDKVLKRLELMVVDDGPGIKEKDIERIFESFYQVDDHGKHPGTGLGLPLARSLAVMHYGSLEAKSDYGHGSCFILVIPTTLEADTTVAVKDAKNENIVVDDHHESSVEENNRSSVLIVEDNNELRRFIVDNLRDDYVVHEASNGIEAMELMENHNIDIIVSDIMMPGMDGIELCRAIRRNDNVAHLPVILLSAKTDVETKVEGLNVGADAYLEKPFSMEQLVAQISTILDNRRRMRENFIKSPLDYYKKAHTEDIHEKENAEFVEKLNQLILDNMTNPEFNIESLARMFCMSRSNFHKKVKSITGKTPNDYIRIIRLSRSVELLSSGRYQIVEVCYMVGFNTPSYFSKCFYEQFGKLPKDYVASNN